MVKWNWTGQMGSNDTTIYICQNTVKQYTLGGRNTDMFLNDATFRQ